jgi:hypothetical protein
MLKALVDMDEMTDVVVVVEVVDEVVVVAVELSLE